MNYQQAHDKIIDAYFKDEIKPMDTQFCFCGTLAGGRHWGGDSMFKYHESEHFYTLREYKLMECALMVGLKAIPIGDSYIPGSERQHENDYEDRLFNGMCMALDILRRIHEQRGEIIEQATFKKRELMGTPGRD